MEKSERSFFLYDDREERTITVKAIKEKYKWIADCPFHQHGQPSLEINIYDGTYICPLCTRKGKLWSKKEFNKKPKETVVEIISLGELLEKAILNLKEGK